MIDLYTENPLCISLFPLYISLIKISQIYNNIQYGATIWLNNLQRIMWGGSSCVYSFRGQCKINSQLTFLLMLFRLLKDALLAFKRALIEVLLTPFWSPSKHLLLLCFASVWFSVSYKGSRKGWFLTSLERFLTILRQYFSQPTRLYF